MAGMEGFEPPILGPEPSALPLGHIPSQSACLDLGINSYYSFLNVSQDSAPYVLQTDFVLVCKTCLGCSIYQITDVIVPIYSKIINQSV